MNKIARDITRVVGIVQCEIALDKQKSNESTPVDDIDTIYKNLIRSALRENPLLTQEQFICQTFEIAEINEDKFARNIIPYIFEFVRCEMALEKH